MIPEDVPAHLAWRTETDRRMRELVALLAVDEPFRLRAWRSMKPAARKSRPAPVLDEYELHELAEALALREMTRAAGRRPVESGRTRGPKRRITDDALRAALADARLHGAVSIRERARRMALWVPLSARQLETRIARLVPAGVRAK